MAKRRPQFGRRSGQADYRSPWCGAGLKPFVELPPSVAAEHLVGKEVFRVVCCGVLPRLVDTFSIPPTDRIDFGRMIYTLQCPKCERRMDVEVFTRMRRQDFEMAFASLGMELEEEKRKEE